MFLEVLLELLKLQYLYHIEHQFLQGQEHQQVPQQETHHSGLDC